MELFHFQRSTERKTQFVFQSSPDWEEKEFEIKERNGHK